MPFKDVDFKYLFTSDNAVELANNAPQQMLCFSSRSIRALSQHLTDNIGAEPTEAVLFRFGFQAGQDYFTHLSGESIPRTQTDKFLIQGLISAWDGQIELITHELDYNYNSGYFALTLLYQYVDDANDSATQPRQNLASEINFFLGWISGWCSRFYGKPVFAVMEADQTSEQGQSRLYLRESDYFKHKNIVPVNDEEISAQSVYKKLESRANDLARDLNNLKTALDSHALVTVFDLVGAIVEVNELFCETSKYSRKDLLGRSYEVLHSDKHPPEFMQALWNTVQRGEVWRGDICNRAKDGSLFWLNSTVLPLLGNSGKPYRYIQIGTDISTEKFAAESMRAAKAAADQANRSKSEFLATMSHELRTPMNGVIGFTNLLLETELTTEQKQYLETIRNSSETLLTLLNNILDLSKVEAGELTLELASYDIRDLLYEVVDLLTPKAREKKLIISIEIGSALPAELVGDQARVRQVVMNLLGNALKFSDKGSVHLIAEPNGPNKIIIKVIDNGIGIKSDKIPLLFRKFFQAEASTARRFGGTGLGLTICRQLVKEMGGNIGAASKYGLGSTFWFTLPVQPEEWVVNKSKHKIIPKTTLSPEKIQASFEELRVLVAEDNPTNQLLVNKVLTNLQCSIDTANTGKEAVELWKNNEYDAVLMDNQMPEMDGIEATRLIRRIESEKNSAEGEHRKRTPIIAFTASVMSSDREACFQAGVDEFLPKPLDKDELIRLLEKVCKRREVVEEVGEF